MALQIQITTTLSIDPTAEAAFNPAGFGALPVAVGASIIGAQELRDAFGSFDGTIQSQLIVNGQIVQGGES